MARCADLFYFGKDCIVVAVDQKLFYILHMAGAQSLRPELIAASAPVRHFSKAQARRLKIRVNGEDGKKYLAHTLNNTVVAPPRMLIAFLENNLNADGTVSIPEVLRMYMGGKEKLVPKH